MSKKKKPEQETVQETPTETKEDPKSEGQIFDAVKEDSQPEPNLKFVGPIGFKLTTFALGAKTYTLPEDQEDCFYHPDAAVIARTFPRYYVLTTGCGCCGKKEVN